MVYFYEKEKLSCLTSALQLVKILNAESQSNKKIFNLIEKFYEILELDNWIKEYILWELELFSSLGYNLELEKLVKKNVSINDEITYSTHNNSVDRKVPNFLIEKNNNVSDKDLLAGLKLVGDFLEKSILRPNNLSYPNNRTSFINSLLR